MFHVLWLFFQVLWPGGTFFLRVGTPQMRSRNGDQMHSQTTNLSGGSNVTKSDSSFEEQLEAARRASDIKKLLFG